MKKILFVLLAFGLFHCTTPAEETAAEADFDLSLAQWSLHKTFFGNMLDAGFGNFGRLLMTNPDSLLQGEKHPDNFPEIAKELGFNTIELVNTFYFSKSKDMGYWNGFKAKCDSLGVKVGLIMCDALGDMGNADSAARAQTVLNHHDWVDIAALLGAHTVRVNAGGAGTAEEVAANAALGLKALAEYAETKNINIVVENHGGYSSDGSWLAGVMQAVNMGNVGTLPDFGNFCIERKEGSWECAKSYDIYKGMEELMPFAKGVSAKSHNFDAEGNETEIDYKRVMDIVKASGFKGTIGVEYEGSELSEIEGIKATKALVEKLL